MYASIKTQLVELPINAGSTLQRFYFPQQTFLRSKQICSLETYTVDDLTISPQGNTLPTIANLQSAYLTLYGDDPEDTNAKGEWIVQLPLFNLHSLFNITSGAPWQQQIYNLVPRNIVWEKSYIDLGAPLGNIANLSFVLNVGYLGTGN